MTTPPTPPSPGKPVSAGFFTRLIGWVKSGMIIEGQGYRLHRGPNGTSLEILVGKSSSYTPPLDCGCFALVPFVDENDGDGKVDYKFVNCFCGDGMSYDNPIEDGEVKASDFVLQGELEEGQEYTDADKPFVYLSYCDGSVAIEAKKTFEEVKRKAANAENGTVLPLYKLKHDGKIAVDFRNMPIFQHIEPI